ncbi:hypothetical protein KC723_00705 [Candidatus Kaiserbacteria bacterium]|nr:hypothetical protein [Candidatus Kaiserbacteria bacterium]
MKPIVYNTIRNEIRRCVDLRVLGEITDFEQRKMLNELIESLIPLHGAETVKQSFELLKKDQILVSLIIFFSRKWMPGKIISLIITLCLNQETTQRVSILMQMNINTAQKLQEQTQT